MSVYRTGAMLYVFPPATGIAPFPIPNLYENGFPSPTSDVPRAAAVSDCHVSGNAPVVPFTAAHVHAVPFEKKAGALPEKTHTSVARHPVPHAGDAPVHAN